MAFHPTSRGEHLVLRRVDHPLHADRTKAYLFRLFSSHSGLPFKLYFTRSNVFTAGVAAIQLRVMGLSLGVV